MRSRKALVIAVGLASLAATTALTGCVSTRSVTIHPISGEDIILLNQGDTITAPKSGAFLSDDYIEEVMRARIGK